MMKSKFWISLVVLVLNFLVSPAFANINELLPEEKSTVEIFQKFSPKVVYVHRLARVSAKHAQHKVIHHISAGAGSGIIWDDKGHVITNYHVIRGADDLAVSLGKMTVPVKVVGFEARKDIAVLAITDAKALKLLKSFTPFKIVHSNDLQVGQKAIAIGNPFGLDHTLTVGIISALGRQVPGIGGVTIRQMIQTDASINPGNSGGPLLDGQGRLIGLNTVIYSNSGSSAGIGFAVPADDIERIAPQIIKHGRVVLSGVGIQRVDTRIASRLGVHKGILIADVIPNTPAATANLRGTGRDQYGRMKLGDVIVGLNGHPVDDYDHLYNLLIDIKVGEEIKLTIQRNDKRINFKMNTIDIASL